MGRSLVSSLFPPWGPQNRPKRGPGFPAAAARPQSTAAPASLRPALAPRSRDVRLSGTPPLLVLLRPGRRRAEPQAGAGGEGRPERVRDTRGGRGRRGGRTPPWEETGQVGPGAGCQRGGDSRLTDRHQYPHPAATQVLCARAALGATALAPAPASARRAALAAAATAPVQRSVLATFLRSRPPVPGFGLSVEARRFLRAVRPRLGPGAARLAECPPT